RSVASLPSSLEGEMTMQLPWRHILLSTDFSPSSEAATQAAIQLALKFDSRLTLLHVCEFPTYPYLDTPYPPMDVMGSIQKVAESKLADVLTQVRKEVPKAESMIRIGSPAAEIIAEVEKLSPDLVIVGSHGRRGMSRFLFGSVAERVVREAPAPV